MMHQEVELCSKGKDFHHQRLYDWGKSLHRELKWVKGVWFLELEYEWYYQNLHSAVVTEKRLGEVLFEDIIITQITYHISLRFKKKNEELSFKS